MIQWNRGCEETYGFAADDAVGQNIETLLHPRDFAALKAALEAAGTWSGKLTLSAKDGRALTAETRLELVKDGRRVVLQLEPSKAG